MCPRFLFVDTNKSAHKGHHPHSHTWSTHGWNRTLTALFGVNIEKRRSPDLTWWRGRHSHPHKQEEDENWEGKESCLGTCRERSPVSSSTLSYESEYLHHCGTERRGQNDLCAPIPSELRLTAGTSSAPTYCLWHYRESKVGISTPL